MDDLDVIDRAAGLAPDAPLGLLRRQRPDVVRHAEGAIAAALEPDDEGGFTRAERAAIALRVALLNASDGLADAFRARLDPLDPGGRLAGAVALDGPPPDNPRWAAILAHADRVTRAPGTSAPEHLHALAGVGLGPRAIVALSQLVALVNYQARVVAGLRLLGETA